MNKLFTKITSLALGAAMMIGVGVAVGSKSKVGKAMADDITGKIEFNNTSSGTAINAAKVTGNDDQENEWTVTTVGTTSFTANAAYYQVGSSSKPATSITFTTTLDSSYTIKAMSAKFGGFSGTAGSVNLKVGTTTIGSGSLSGTSDVTISSTDATKSGSELTVTVTGIAKGVKVYYVSYTYVSSGGGSSGGTAEYTVTAKNAATAGGTKPAGSTVSYTQTYGTAKQATSGNSFTMTLNGYAGKVIKSASVEVHSNGSGGAGNLSLVSGSSTIASIPTSNFNTSNWNGSYTSSYVTKTLSVTETTIQQNATIVLTIAATANSLYFQKLTIGWEDAPQEGTLSSISLSGDYPTEFEQNSTFNHDGMIVTANYTNPESHVIVTGSATWSSPDMSTTGEKTVTVTYETVHDDYTITVVAPKLEPTWVINDQNPLALTVGTDHTLNVTTQAGLTPTFTSNDSNVATVNSNGVISPVGGGSTTITMSTEGNTTYKAASASITVNVTYPEPSVITGKTIAELVSMASYDIEHTSDTLKEKKVLYQLTGYVISIDNTTYGNIHLSDTNSGEGTVVYGLTATTENTLVFNQNTGLYDFTNPKDYNTDGKITKGIAEGDKISGLFRAYIYTPKSGDPYLELDGLCTSVSVPVSGVTISDAQAVLSASTEDSAHTLQLGATVTPENASNKTVSWESSDDEIVTVSSTGLITGVSAGSATVTVTTEDGGFSASCAVTVENSIVDVTGVTLNKDSTNIIIGGTETLEATVLPADAANKNVSWSSSNSSIASVDSDGLVTANAVGSATITVTTQDGGKQATCVVTVDPKATTGISLDITEKTIQAGEHVTLTATVTPADATDKSVTWSTNNSSVATVSNGVVTAVAVGSATITATASGGQKATCAITVRAVETFIVDLEEFEAFVKVTDESQLENGQYLIVYEGEDSSVALDLREQGDAAHNGLSVTIDDSIIEASATNKAIAFTLNASTGSLLAPCGSYITHTGTKNTLNFSDEEVGHTISIDGDVATIGISDSSYKIRYNPASDQERFRYYTSAANVSLYKLENAGGPTPYTIGDDLYDAIFGLMTWDESEGKFLLEQCDYEYGTTFNVSTWNAMASTFSSLKTTYKLNRGVAEDGGNIVEQFLSVYDYVIGTKKPLGGAWATANDFLDRYAEGGINYGKDSLVKSPLLSSIGDTSTTAIIIISVIGVSALGGFFFLRKRKEI